RRGRFSPSFPEWTAKDDGAASVACHRLSGKPVAVCVRVACPWPSGAGHHTAESDPSALLLSIELRNAAAGGRRRDRLQPRIDVCQLSLRENVLGVRDHLFGGLAHVARERRPGRDAARQARSRNSSALGRQTVTLPAGSFDEELLPFLGIA